MQFPNLSAGRLTGVAALACTAALIPATALASTASGAAPATASGPVPRGFEPVSMTFVSGSDGWVLGTAPCTHKPRTSIVRTTDGGRSWAGIPAPRFPLDPSS